MAIWSARGISWTRHSFAVMVFGFEIAYRSYQRKGEEIRRNILMDDSFGTRYFQLPAEGYYDNEGTESGVRKLLANIHQSAFTQVRYPEKC